MGYVIIHGRKAQIIGRICRDQFMVDVSEIPEVKKYDVVVLMGDGLNADDMANMLGTIGYEIVCGIGKRIESIFVIKRGPKAMRDDYQIKKHYSNRKLGKRIYCYLCTKYLYKKAGSVGLNCRANAYVKVTKNTYIGEHSNFNGMSISGSGKITIGSWFHSGQDIRIITDNHNYEGEAIPYDSTDIVKDVTIDDFVWIGSHVIILGGGAYR